MPKSGVDALDFRPACISASLTSSVPRVGRRVDGACHSAHTYRDLHPVVVEVGYLEDSRIIATSGRLRRR